MGPSWPERRLEPQRVSWSASNQKTHTRAAANRQPTGATPLRFARRLAMALKILGWGTMVGVAFIAITSLKTWMAPLASRAAQMNLDYAQRDAANKHLKTARQASSES